MLAIKKTIVYLNIQWVGELRFFFFWGGGGVKEMHNYWLGWPTWKWLRVLKFNQTLFNIFNGDIRDLNSLFCQLLNYNSYKNKIKNYWIVIMKTNKTKTQKYLFLLVSNISPFEWLGKVHIWDFKIGLVRDF